jgi:hypothetical protein
MEDLNKTKVKLSTDELIEKATKIASLFSYVKLTEQDFTGEMLTNIMELVDEGAPFFRIRQEMHKRRGAIQERKIEEYRGVFGTDITTIREIRSALDGIRDGIIHVGRDLDEAFLSERNYIKDLIKQEVHTQVQDTMRLMIGMPDGTTLLDAINHIVTDEFKKQKKGK